MKRLSVLITGNTALAINSPLRRNVYLSNLNLAVEGVRRLGHRVEQRAVIPGEDLSDYDRVIVYMIPITAMVATYTYGALWAMATRPDCVVAVSDLEVYDLCNSFKVVARDDERLWRRVDSSSNYRCIGHDNDALSLKGEDRLVARRRRREIKRVIEMCADGHIPYPIVAPVFEWGDPSKLPIDCSELRWWDPSHLVDMKAIARMAGDVPMRKRKRQWVLGGLLRTPNMLRKLKLAYEGDDSEDRWPVEFFGPGTDNGFVPEGQLLQNYAKNWGVAGRPYGSAGSGWWRIRWVEAAAVGNVVCMSERDTKLIDPTGSLEWDPKVIEKMSYSELKQLAFDFRALIKKRRESKIKTMDRISRAFLTQGDKSWES